MPAKRRQVAPSNDESALWREYRRAQQERRASRLGPRTDEILALQGKGFHVRALTDFQFRIDSTLDLYPIHKRYHHLPTEKRGDYHNALACAVKFCRSLRERT